MSRFTDALSALIRPDRWPLAGAVASAALLLGALAFEHLGNYPPCPLCIDQRWVHVWALIAGVAGFAAMAGVRALGPRAARDAARAMEPVVQGSRLKRFWLALRAPAGIARTACGALAAIFAWSSWQGLRHAGAEYGWWRIDCQAVDMPGMTAQSLFESLGEAQNVVLCDEAAWTLLGISMAGYNALFSAALCVISLVAMSRSPSWRVL
ncbi:MAG: disulfide bond formation protein B [Oceanicaulis sp.]